MPTRPRQDAYDRFNVVLELDGKPIAGFSEVTGLSADVSAIDYRAGTATQPGVGKFPGLHKHVSITLQRGAANRKVLFEWQANGAANRRGATIVLFDAARQPLARWRVVNAWISKIEGPTLQATGNDVAIESLELTHEGLSLAE